MSEKPAKEVTVKERCLVCQGEGWIPEPLEAGRSKPCPYCQQSGWIEVPSPPVPGPEKRPQAVKPPA